MKKFFLILLLVTFNSFSAIAGVKEVGNGGDVYALQFVTLAEQVLNYLQNAENKDVNLSELANAIDATKVESTTERLVLNGMEKDAINYREEMIIVFNRQRWSSMVTEEKLALVLHEYLSILKIEDASYKISKKLLLNFEVSKKIFVGSDNLWLLCHSDSLVVNLFEHRAGGDTRTTEINLMFGGHSLTGALFDVLEGPVALKDPRWNGIFTGDVKLNFQDNRITIKGIMTLSESTIDIDTTLKCTEKSGRN